MRIPALLLLGSLALATPLAAQETAPEPHRGLWGGFGLGTGINLSEGDAWGFTTYGRIGGTPRQRVLLGGEWWGWAGSRNGTDLLRGNLSAIALLYPVERGGLFLKVGVGFGYMQTEYVSALGTVSQDKGGFGATAGAGFEVRLGSNTYLVPGVDWYLQSVGSEAYYEFQGLSGTNNTLAFTLGLLWH